VFVMLDRSRARTRGAVVVAALVGCLAVAATAVATVAVTSGGGTTGKVDFATSQILLETPANVYQKVTTMDVTTSSGPLVVRFDAQAYDEGKRNINDRSGQTASFSWATTASNGKHTIQVDFRNLNQFDVAGLVRWTLTADHG
jgi:opacity protein-like surface antigen